MTRLQELLDELRFGAVPLTEVWKKGKLVSDTPVAVRHCVVKVFKSLGGDKAQGDDRRDALSRAFAICMSSMQKAGQVKPGTRKLTKKGAGKAGWRMKDPETKTKDREYEQIVQSVRKGE